jgi:ankyrin repeat protein
VPYTTIMERLKEAIDSDDAAAVARVLEEQPQLKAQLDDALPGAPFGQTALLVAVGKGNRDMVDVLLRAGASINQKSHWWAGGFHVLDDVGREPWLASFLLGRGATPEIHHAVLLGMFDEVRRMLSEDPAAIHARGGDGQLPLHYAQTVEMADFLLNRGADINARDVDHESTAAQWMVRDRQSVARFLLKRGAETDILMASALGDVARVREFLDADSRTVRVTVSEEHFPMKDPRAGGTIYIWTLGGHKTAHAIAREFGHEAVHTLLMERTTDEMKLALACEDGDEDRVDQLLSKRRDLGKTLSEHERPRLATAAEGNKTTAVRLMLRAGWPTDVRGPQEATALHWAGFHGNAEMARMLLSHGAPVNAVSGQHPGPPIHWAIYGSVHGWHCRSGDYPGTVEALIAAGAEVPPITDDLQASPAVLTVLRRHRPNQTG